MMVTATDETPGADPHPDERHADEQEGGRARRGLLASRGTLLGRGRRHLPIAVVLTMLVAQGAFLGWLAKDLWFVWGDDYDFLLMRGTVPGAGRNWLEPHDDHWMTSVIAIFRVIFHFVGIRSYLPYAMVPIVFHLALALVMYLIGRRLGAGAWMSVASAAFVAFLGAGAQAVLWDTTMGLIGSALLGFVAVYVGLHRGFGRDTVRWVWLPLVLGLTFSGTGVVAVAFVTAFAWCRDGWRTALRVLSVPTVVFLVWYVAYGRSGAKEPLSNPWDYLQTPGFVWTGLTAAVGRASGIPDAGGVLTIALLSATVLAPRHIPPGLRDLALAGILAAVGQLTLAVLTRPGFGIEAFSSGRYSYLVLVFLTPSVLVSMMGAAALVREPRPVIVLLVALLGLAYVVNGEHLFRRDYQGRLMVTDQWPGIMRGLRAAAQAEQRVLTIEPDEYVHKRFRPDLAAHPVMWDELPEGEATGRERLEAERRFYVSVAREGEGLLVPTDVRLSFGFTSQPEEEGGCSEHETRVKGAIISVDTGETGAEVGLSGPADELTVWLERDGVESSKHEWEVKPDTGYFVSSTAKDAELLVAVNEPGTYRLCRG